MNVFIFYQVVVLDYKSIICPGKAFVMHLQAIIEEVTLKALICLVLIIFRNDLIVFVIKRFCVPPWVAGHKDNWSGFLLTYKLSLSNQNTHSRRFIWMKSNTSTSS